ncbi:MAG: Crp/Fnr family transcriptional regulator [Trueperaceae bacterium]|nr:Crp/Fnr family transcriptional regulator [Trueperaceae bacterium]
MAYSAQVPRADPSRFAAGGYPLPGGAELMAEVPASRVPPATWDLATSRDYLKGEVVYSGGEASEFAFVIEAGLVALTLAAHPERERVVALAGPGDIIGELTPGTQRYLETATALSAGTRCRLLARAAHADTSGPGGVELQSALALAAGRQLARLTDAMADTEVAVPARIARTLVRLGERFGHRGEDGLTRITLPITHDTLAAMVGAARETTTSVVQALRDDGLLNGTRGHYLFEPEKLSAFAARAL